MSKLGLIVAALCAASAMAVAYSAWRALADVEAGGAGLLAAILAGVAALAVGGGLAALLFWSHRKGFDERAGARSEVQRPLIPHSDSC
jgi:uncharacterized iron-regulated membrane protein